MDAEAKMFGPKRIVGLPPLPPGKLMESLLQHREDPEMLQVKIMQNVTQFTEILVLRQLILGQHQWLEQALLQMRPCSALNCTEIVGLCMCMIALKGAAASHIATFLSDLSEADRKTCVGHLRSKLECIYARDGVRQWLTDFPELVEPESLRLADFLEKHVFLADYMYLDLARVVELPPALSEYSLYVEQYLKSDKSDWISQSLKI